MWLIPYTDGQDHILTINMGHVTQLLGMRVWNYNKSADDTFRGVSKRYAIFGKIPLKFVLNYYTCSDWIKLPRIL